MNGAAGSSPLRLAMVAGEASGDLLAQLLIGGLRARWPDVQLSGIGGPKMRAVGLDAWWPQEKLAVRGYIEVMRHYRELSAMRDQLAERLIAERPHAFVGVDVPDFNLGLEATLKRAGISTAHFVCPSIWAWRGGRAKKMAASCDHVLCLFPFEPELLAAHGVAASFVGHPLADAIPLEPPRESARAALGLPADAEVVALLPGSRTHEVNDIGPVFLQAAAQLRRERPGLRFVIPVVEGLGPRLRALCERHAPELDVLLVDGHSHEALAACDATMIASGTATLEAALFKRPMAIAYRMHPFTWQIMKRMRYQPWVGLPNILCREFVVPELIQGDCTPEALAAATRRWLDDPAAARRVAERFDAIHRSLRRDTAGCATDAIAQLIGRA